MFGAKTPRTKASRSPSPSRSAKTGSPAGAPVRPNASMTGGPNAGSAAVPTLRRKTILGGPTVSSFNHESRSEARRGRTPSQRSATGGLGADLLCPPLCPRRHGQCPQATPVTPPAVQQTRGETLAAQGLESAVQPFESVVSANSTTRPSRSTLTRQPSNATAVGGCGRIALRGSSPVESPFRPNVPTACIRSGICTRACCAVDAAGGGLWTCCLRL